MLTPTKWRQKAARLADMSWDEISTRLRQELAKRTDAVAFGLGVGSVAAELRGPSQRRRKDESPPPLAASQLGRFFFSTDDLPRIEALLRERFPHETTETIDQAKRICRHEFDLLGYRGLRYGASIDWRWDPVNNKRAPRKVWYKIRYLDIDQVGDHKIVWELNRHQHFVTLAKAYWLTQEPKYVTELLNEWRHWQRENRYPAGINWASSLEVAFRSLAWLWVGHMLASSPAAPASFERDLLRGLALNARHIERHFSTYWSPNTHLLGEAVALFFIGALCPELRSAARWQETGWRIILQQAERQVQPDGWHFEQSVHYHVYALDFFLHARILAGANEIAIPPEFDRTIVRMLEALQASSQAGLAPRFGDDDGGRVFDPRRNRCEHMLDPLSTGAILYGRPDFKASSGELKEESLWLLGPEGVRRFDELDGAPPSLASTRFESSGLCVMASYASEESGDSPPTPARRQLVIDGGPQGTGSAGHSHADALSVQLSIAGEQWLIDPGTFRYISAGGERDIYRGTGAHNTMQVDGRDQADPFHPFGWKALPLVKTDLWVTGERFDLFAGRHEGYRRFPKPVTHRRWVFHLKPHFWLVRDLADGEGEHDLEISWHFAPTFTPSYTPPGFTLSRAVSTGQAEEAHGLTIFPVEGHGWAQEIRRGRVSPAYGVEEPAPIVCFVARKTLPADFVSVLQPVDEVGEGAASLKRVEAAEGSGAQGYRYTVAGGQHLFFFADRDGKWEVDSWASDARFVYAGLRGDGERVHLAFCAGSRLDFGSKRLLECDRPVERCEVTLTRKGHEIWCSDPNAVAGCNPANLHSLLEALLASKVNHR